MVFNFHLGTVVGDSAVVIANAFGLELFRSSGPVPRTKHNEISCQNLSPGLQINSPKSVPYA